MGYSEQLVNEHVGSKNMIKGSWGEEHREMCSHVDDKLCSGCPGEPMMPWYLIVGGVLTIGLVLVRYN